MSSLLSGTARIDLGGTAACFGTRRIDVDPYAAVRVVFLALV